MIRDPRFVLSLTAVTTLMAIAAGSATAWIKASYQMQENTRNVAANSAKLIELNQQVVRGLEDIKDQLQRMDGMSVKKGEFDIWVDLFRARLEGADLNWSDRIPYMPKR